MTHNHDDAGDGNILDAIRSSPAGQEAKDLCLHLMSDAIARRSQGSFNLYGALAVKNGDQSWKMAYRNPTGEKHAFLPVLQVLAAATGARVSGLVTEGWHLDTRNKSTAEMVQLQKKFDREGFSISKHPEARECLFVTVETDDEMLVATVSLPIEEGKTIMVYSSRDEQGPGVEGTMTGLRPSPSIRLSIITVGMDKAHRLARELEMDWISLN